MALQIEEKEKQHLSKPKPIMTPVLSKVASEFLKSASVCPLVPKEVREERGRESHPGNRWRSAAWVFMDTAVSHLACECVCPHVCICFCVCMPSLCLQLNVFPSSFVLSASVKLHQICVFIDLSFFAVNIKMSWQSSELRSQIRVQTKPAKRMQDSCHLSWARMSLFGSKRVHYALPPPSGESR